MFKYKSFWRLYAQSLVLSIPQIVTGYLCMQYLDFPLLDYEWSYIGLASSWLFSPLMVQVTRFKLMGINTIMLAIGIIGLSIEDYSSQLVYKIFTCLIGIIVGCDWLLTIRFIREQVGWEEKRSVYLNNNPIICFFLGTLLRISYIKNQNLEDEQIVISSLVILTNSIRLLSFLTIFGKQTLEYYYRKFKELQGRVIIKNEFSGNIKEIEYFYISNNEAYSELNRRTSALFSKQYRKRFFGCVILALLSWFQFNNHNYFPQPDEIFKHPLRYFIPAILTIAVLSQIIYRKFNVRYAMIFFNILLLILSILHLMKIKLRLQDQEILINFSMLLSYIIYYIGLNLLITQQLPYKGITYALNLTFVSLCGAQQISHLITLQVQSNENCWLKYIQTIANILCFPVLLQLKNVKQLRECEIQQVYD
ncbi:unnamed protein product [Paramecium pentaurelia]|uniref:Uncharacterized protein n=1 Tax=Paramecium pentaurelia TaxID=43138 RepID=A0A8S1TF13_9CILI|nr:unnamed protein product [Paramecium pentaurelia]